MKPQITMIVPYYRQPAMLLKQMETLESYPSAVRDAFYAIVVDDCSPESAEAALTSVQTDSHLPHRPDALYRIDKDIPWNRGMARNLGTKMATTPWVLHVDTDHILPAAEAAKLASRISLLGINAFYRFKRYRVGAADDTRRKDKLAPDCTFGEIKPHIDSYLCTPDAYWQAGGYNEDFSGILGGGSPFLAEMIAEHGEPQVLPIALHVYTRDKVPDSSVNTLPRSPAAFAQRKKEIMAKRRTLRGHNPIRLPWHKVF